MTVKAIYDENDIAFLVVWDDAFKDATHDADQELDVAEIQEVGNFNSYVAANDMVPRQLETFRDSDRIAVSRQAAHGDQEAPLHAWQLVATGAPVGVESGSGCSR